MSARGLEGGPGNAPFHKSSFLIFLLFVPLFAVLVVLLLGVMQWKQLRILVAQEPAGIEHVPESEAAEDSLAALVKGFLADGRADSLPDTLVLSARDVNHFVRISPTIDSLGWRYHIGFQDSVAVVRTSVPTEKMTGPVSYLIRIMRVKGYLNSEVHVRPDLRNGKLILTPIRARMNREAAPPTALTKQGDLEPRDWAADKQAFDRALANLESIEIDDRGLILVRKP